jgi:hypothetical protein
MIELSSFARISMVFQFFFGGGQLPPVSYAYELWHGKNYQQLSVIQVVHNIELGRGERVTKLVLSIYINLACNIGTNGLKDSRVICQRFSETH